ncbi:hypothetical protein [Curtobacterium sp. VKM Ac-1376]|uniref:hypothetical protein n=1 Tax=Curtobacterium sp. VKM Ac-1376 TaxID=123312 RepID=UPI00188CBF7D|nr:hypothetical protein [Curtobacterium sp. VKM Ac-1376]MBF4616203.1 hypothetical protein [Curtobacterium sp. VKM Ac-1376]
MSDTTRREIPAPPRRNAGASSLLKANRNPRVEPAQDEKPAPEERTVAPPPPLPARQQPQQVETPANTGVSMTVPAAVQDSAANPAPAVSPTESLPAVEPAMPSQAETEQPAAEARAVGESAASKPSTPYARRRGEASEDLTDDDIVKVTFEIRKGDREAFNAAHAAAKLFEGYPFPKDLIVAIYNAETKRLQDEYNNGQPFPRSGKKAPRGRPIQSNR